MSRLLEELPVGTPVHAKDGVRVGEVRAVYGSGDGRVAEFLLVRWSVRDEEALVAADEVTQISEQGVTLGKNAGSYDLLAAFDPSANPMLHRLV